MSLTAVLIAACVALMSVGVPPAAPANMRPPALQSEKDARTPAQQKINSQVLYEIYRKRGLAEKKQVPPGPTGVQIDRTGRALVDVRVAVTPAMRKKVIGLGATIVSTSAKYRSIVAWIPLLKIERLAAERTVIAIEPKAEASHKQDAGDS